MHPSHTCSLSGQSRASSAACSAFRHSAFPAAEADRVSSRSDCGGPAALSSPPCAKLCNASSAALVAVTAVARAATRLKRKQGETSVSDPCVSHHKHLTHSLLAKGQCARTVGRCLVFLPSAKLCNASNAASVAVTPVQQLLHV